MVGKVPHLCALCVPLTLPREAPGKVCQQSHPDHDQVPLSGLFLFLSCLLLEVGPLGKQLPQLIWSPQGGPCQGDEAPISNCAALVAIFLLGGYVVSRGPTAPLSTLHYNNRERFQFYVTED